ncbi:putative AH domain-containing protein [Lupinus albus]|uniref:Putative AH domain-containing protein n=1 Tax=Lupinus albus TaxID=3870 RepID=A0A6A4NKV7_LUPAL|nr:putative AH domain-containing protein [Lupinus albus]
MKSSLNKLKRIAFHKSVVKDKRDFHHSVKLDELVNASKDMQEMRNCYDSLLSAAAATENSAYEFSESLREMGTCLLEKTALNDDDGSGKILGMLGRVQLEIQKLVDSYRSHIVVTITNPSESLLNELRTVEDMKRQCDEKRDVYEYMIAQQKEKGRSKSGKGESFTYQQLQAAHDEYEDEATLCAFRLKSLKQGQSRSLLTQAARHHAAQLNFFRKGLKSLEAVEPHVRLVTEQHHIDYQFSGLEDDVEDGTNDGENNSEANDGCELSFDYKSKKMVLDVVSTSKNSTEVEESNHSNIRALITEAAESSLDKNLGDTRVSSRDLRDRISSYSAPIIAEKKFDPAEKARQLLSSSSTKRSAYVLPTPVDIKETNNLKRSGSATCVTANSFSHNLWHSSPLDEKKNERDTVDGKLSEPSILRAQSVLKESNSGATSTQLPRPLADGISLPQADISNASDPKKMKTQAFSGPLTSKPMSLKSILAGGSVGPIEVPPLVSGVWTRLPMPQSSSPKASTSASPPHVSSPRVSELHELPRPRPPGNQSAKSVKSSQTGHSAPLLFRNPERPATSKFPSVVLSAASPLPTPPLVVSRSFSIPCSNQRAMALHVAKFLDTPQVPERIEEAASPPLTTASLSDIKRASSISDLASRSSEIRVDAGGR